MSACWHCHTGVEAFPLNIACKFKIPLLIYGESVAETSGKATYLDNPEFSIDYFLQMSAKVKPEEMLCTDINQNDIKPFLSPTKEEIESVGLKRIFLGDFIFWDSERQTEFVRDYLDWKEDVVEGTYKQYKSVECVMPGVHDYAKFLKRGFGRTTDFSVQDVRAGLMTLQESFKLQNDKDPVRPEILNYYLNITNYNEDEFGNILETHRDVLSKKYLPNTKEMTKHKKISVNDSVKKLVDNINVKSNADILLNGLQKNRIFPNYNINHKKTKNNLLIEKNFKSDQFIDNIKIKNITAAHAIDLIIKNKITAVSLLNAYFDQFKKYEKYVNAWTVYDYENALVQAELIDEGLADNKYIEV